jgi:phosphoribosylanthranilate isomerase
LAASGYSVTARIPEIAARKCIVNFKIKICGITSVEDAQAAVHTGADAVGLNFYSSSKRHVDPSIATKIVEASLGCADAIGVFVNERVERLGEICRKTGLLTVQLHGDETPEFVRLVDEQYNVIRARRLDERGIAAIRADWQACCELTGFGPDAVLVDAAAPGQFGGSGQTVDWHALADHSSTLGVPLILAGGLTPDNVAEAIRIVRPQAVDVASGVESSPGKKDVAKMRDFTAAARAAFGAL